MNVSPVLRAEMFCRIMRRKTAVRVLRNAFQYLERVGWRCLKVLVTDTRYPTAPCCASMTITNDDQIHDVFVSSDIFVRTFQYESAEAGCADKNAKQENAAAKLVSKLRELDLKPRTGPSNDTTTRLITMAAEIAILQDTVRRLQRRE